PANSTRQRERWREQQLNQHHEPERVADGRTQSAAQKKVQEEHSSDQNAGLPEQGPGYASKLIAPEVESLNDRVEHHDFRAPFFLDLISDSISSNSASLRSPVSSRH